MTSFALSHPEPNIRLIKGEVVKPKKNQRVVGGEVSRLAKARLYKVQRGMQVTYLRAARIVTRPSGRRDRHLARYLVGVCTRTGLAVEVFLGTVRGLRSGLFRAGLALQRAGLKLASKLAHSLNPFQKLEAIW